MRHSILIVLASLLLAGCIGTKSNVVRPNAAPAGAQLWYTIENAQLMTPAGLDVLQGQLDARLAAVRVADGTPGALHVKVEITHYYFRHAAVRATVGAMAGVDRIWSNVVVLDPGTGTELGRIEVQSKNPTAVGSSNQLIRDHADEIADFVLAVRR